MSDRPVTERAAATDGQPMGRGLAGVTAAGWLGNILSYLLLLAAARRLGNLDYAELVTLFNLLLIGSIPSFALQAVAARRMATGQAHGLWQAGLAIGFGAALLIAVASPLLVAFLHLPGAAGSLLVAVSMPGTALQGLCQGVVQGEQRFAGLAGATFAGIAGKSAAGLIGLLAGGTATVTMTAIAVGVSLAAALSVLALPELRHRSSARLGELGPLIAECGHASHAYGVFLLLSVSDVLLARHVLPASTAAVYAAGSVLTKASLWFPQSIANVLFASLADRDRHHRVFGRAVAAIAGLAAVLSLASWLLGRLVAAVVGGNRYPQLAPDVWLFALLGGCLAIMQFSLVAGLAIRSVSVTALIWLSVAAEAVGVLALGGHPAVRTVIGLVAAINLVTACSAVLLRLAPSWPRCRATVRARKTG